MRAALRSMWWACRNRLSKQLDATTVAAESLKQELIQQQVGREASNALLASVWPHRPVKILAAACTQCLGWLAFGLT